MVPRTFLLEGSADQNNKTFLYRVITGVFNKIKKK